MVFIDTDNKCHITNDGTMRGFETELTLAVFNGKCPAYIEGCRYIPMGEFWTSPDGKAFPGEAIFPCEDLNVLSAYQRQYEAMLPEMEDMKTALNSLEVRVDGQMD